MFLYCGFKTNTNHLYIYETEDERGKILENLKGYSDVIKYYTFI